MIKCSRCGRKYKGTWRLELRFPRRRSRRYALPRLPDARGERGSRINEATLDYQIDRLHFGSGLDTDSSSAESAYLFA